MTRKGAIFAYPVLIALAFLGAWLIGLIGEEEKGDVSGSQMLMSLFGFFIFLGSLVGTVYLIGQKRRPLSRSEMVLWEVVRKRGRRFYLKRATLKGFLLGLATSLVLLLFTGQIRSFGSRQLCIFIFLVLIITFACYYAASRTWDVYETAYRALSKQQ